MIAAGGADSRYPVVAAACPRPIAPFEIEWVTVACGKVSVPEDLARPEGRRIDLTVMRFKSRSLAQAPDAVVRLRGGPGGGIINEVNLTATFFENLRSRRDVVAFDQRALSREMTRACLDEIKASGADISKINTERNAMDVGAVTKALGCPVYNVYGLSYGTKLGLEVMRTAPEGVRSVVLDTAWPRRASRSTTRWGALAASTLPKGQLAFLPETGHGALAFSQCARDIGAAFLENPEAKIDASCAEALLPSFVPPDGAMSR